MKSAILRSSIVAATLTFGVFSAPQAHAGPKEIAAITTKLGKDISQATWQEVATAVVNAINDPANKKLKAATILGEALKSNPLPTPGGQYPYSLGDALGDAIRGAKLSGNLPPSALSATKTSVFSTFIGSAAATAATSTGATTQNLADFSQHLFTTAGEQTALFEAAGFATKSKSAVGQLLAGFAANQFGNDTAQNNLAIAALANSKLAGSAKEIAFGITPFVSDAKVADFVKAVTADTKKGIPKLLLVATGATAAQGNKGDAILEALFGNAVYVPSTKKVTATPQEAATIKNAAKLASGLSLVGDTENVTEQAIIFGQKIQANVLKATTLTTITKGLISGITNRPLNYDNTGRINNNIPASVFNSVDNRIDEIGEVASVLSVTFLKSAVFTVDVSTLTDKKKESAKKAAVNALVGFLKTVYGASGKLYNEDLKKAVTNLAFKNNVIADAAGGIVQTLVNTIATANGGSGAMSQAIKDALVDAFKSGNALATATKIVGKTAAAGLSAALIAAAEGTTYAPYFGVASLVFEDGNAILGQYDPVTHDLGTVNDPETDSRGVQPH